MSEQKSMGVASRFIAIVIAFVVVLAAFYGLDHFIMSIQGLPLNADLTPAG
ncbi:MAG: hypothetical protein ABFR65_12440 [Pseudomonadota bacterium]